MMNDDVRASSLLPCDTTYSDRGDCCKKGNPDIYINFHLSSSIEKSSDIQVIDTSDSNKFDIDNHPNQNSVNDCDTNLKSVNMDDMMSYTHLLLLVVNYHV